MSKVNLKVIKDRLIAERELLVNKLQDNDLSVDDSETPDPVDLAVRNYSKNVMLAVSENESRQLTLIDEALLRIKDDEIWAVPKLRETDQPETSGGNSVGKILPGLSAIA
jgi:RNA polymerase-binding transcription factor DksA